MEQEAETEAKAAKKPRTKIWAPQRKRTKSKARRKLVVEEGAPATDKPIPIVPNLEIITHGFNIHGEPMCLRNNKLNLKTLKCQNS